MLPTSVSVSAGVARAVGRPVRHWPAAVIFHSAKKKKKNHRMVRGNVYEFLFTVKAHNP